MGRATQEGKMTKRIITMTMIAMAAVPSQAAESQPTKQPGLYSNRPAIASTLGFGPTAGSDSQSLLHARQPVQMASLLCIRAHK